MGPTLPLLLVASVATLAGASKAEGAHGDVPDLGDAYMQQRRAIILGEQSMAAGADLALSPDERRLDEVLAASKQAEYNREPAVLPSLHFFQARPLIEQSPLFATLQRMPKGAALHVHSDSMVDVPWLVANATYDGNLHACGELDSGNGTLTFRFFSSPAAAPPCAQPTGWRQVAALRNASVGGAAEFDKRLVAALSLGNDPAAYPTQASVWQQFESALTAVDGIVFYDPVHTRYIQRAMQLFHDDGVSVLELRQLIVARAGTYALNGTVLPAEDMLTKLQALSDAFKRDHPATFFGIRVIYCSLRFAPPEEVAAALAHATELFAEFPDLVVGYDLVGREDTGEPLLYYREELESAQARAKSAGRAALPYYFHAGETDRRGSPTDQNLVDALLLSTRRVGHGYALGSHPLLRTLVSEQSVGIEVCPISNQVLMLLRDLRNHPLRTFVAEDLPLTVSPDDPALWGAVGSSYDFFQAFLVAGNATGLALLKQLSLNSLLHSSLSESEKPHAVRLWEAQWAKFVKGELGRREGEVM